MGGQGLGHVASRCSDRRVFLAVAEGEALCGVYVGNTGARLPEIPVFLPEVREFIGDTKSRTNASEWASCARCDERCRRLGLFRFLSW